MKLEMPRLKIVAASRGNRRAIREQAKTFNAPGSSGFAAVGPFPLVIRTTIRSEGSILTWWA
jgi:hypothetical protein